MRWILLALFLAGAATTGCVVTPAEPQPDIVVVAPGHACSDICTHYYHRGHFYLVEGHRHGPGCGHALQQGLWIVMEDARPSPRAPADSTAPERQTTK